MPVVGRPRRFVQKAHFRVEVNGVSAGSFTKVGPFRTEWQVAEQKEGGAASPVDKTPTVYSHPNITLEGPQEIGDEAPSTLHDWNEAQKAGDRTKRTVSVVAVDPDGTELYRYNCTGCSLVAYTDADFDRSAESENVMQVAEIAITAFTRVAA